MREELGEVLDEEKFNQLIGRLRELYDQGTLQIQDWVAIYDIMLEALERDKAETFERFMEARINGEDDDE